MTVALASLRTELGADTSSYVRAMTEAAAAAGRMGAADTALGEVVQQTDAKIKGTTATFDRYRASIDPVFAAKMKLEEGTKRLQRAVELERVTETDHARLLGLLTERYDTNAIAARRAAEAQEQAAQAQVRAAAQEVQAAAIAAAAEVEALEKLRGRYDSNYAAAVRYNGALADLARLAQAGALSGRSLAEAQAHVEATLNPATVALENQRAELVRVAAAQAQATASLSSLRGRYDADYEAAARYNAALKDLASLEQSGALAGQSLANAQAHVEQTLNPVIVAVNKEKAELKTLLDSLNPAAVAAAKFASEEAVLNRALAATELTAEQHAAALKTLRERYNQIEPAAGNAARGVRLAAHQVTNLTYQVQDAAVQLAGGQNPFLILIQQGPQASGAVGGVNNLITLMGQGLRAMVSPTGLAVAGVAALAAAAAVVAARIADINSEMRRTQTIMAAMNPGSTVTAEQMRASSFAIAEERKVSRSDASAALLAANSNRNIGGGLARQIAGVSQDFAAVWGGDAEAAARKLADTFAKGASGVAQLDREIGFLSVEQYKNMRVMEEHGDRAGALAVAIQALEGRVGGSAQKMRSDWGIAFSEIGKTFDTLIEKIANTDFMKAFADQAKLEAQAIRALIDGTYWTGGQTKEPGAGSAAGAAGGVPTPAVNPDMTDDEKKRVIDLKNALDLETKAMEGNAAERSIRIAGIQAEIAALEAGRTGAAATAERLIAETRARLQLNTASNDALVLMAAETKGLMELADAYQISKEQVVSQIAWNEAHAASLAGQTRDEAALRQAILERAAAQAQVTGGKQLEALQDQVIASKALAAAALEGAAAEEEATRQNQVRLFSEQVLTAAIKTRRQDMIDAAEVEVRKFEIRTKAAQDYNRATSFNRAVKAQQDALALAQEEYALIGQMPEQIARQAAQLRAVNELKARGKDITSAEGQQYIQNAGDLAVLQTRTQEVQRIAGEATDHIVESFAEMRDGGKDSFQQLRDFAVKMLDEIAAQAIIRPIIQPIVGQAVGTLYNQMAGAVGAGPAGGAGAAGGMGQAGQAANMLGSTFQAGGAGASLMGTTLVGGTTTGAISQSGSLAAAYTTGPIAGSAGGLTLGAGLGAAAGGAAVGGLVGSFVGNKTGSKAAGALSGAASGAAMGAMMGGPWGAVIGGVAGGIMGLLGTASKPSNMEGNATTDLLTGRTTIGGQEGKKFSQENRDAARKAAEGFAGVGQMLGAYSDRRMEGALKVVVGNRDGISADFGGESRNFKRNDAGMKEMTKFVVESMAKSMGEDLPKEIATVMKHVDWTDVQKAIQDIQFGGEFSDSIKALKGDFGLVDQAAADAKKEVRDLTDQIAEFRSSTKRLGLDTDAANEATKSYVEGLVGLRKVAEPLSDVRQEVETARVRFAALPPLLKLVGIAADEASKGFERFMTIVRTNFLKNIERAIADITQDPTYAFQDLLDKQHQRLDDAIAIGADISRVERLNALERQAFLEKLTATQRKMLGGLVNEAERLSLVISDVKAQIFALIDQQIDLAKDAASAAKQAATAYRALAKAMADAIRQLRGGDLSPLTPAQQLTEKRSNFETMAAKALAGNQEALGELPGIAQDFLTASRQYNASSDAYTADFARVMGVLAQAQELSGKIANSMDVEVTILNKQVELLGLIKDAIASGNTEALQQHLASLGELNKQHTENIGSLSALVGGQTKEMVAGNASLASILGGQGQELARGNAAIAALMSGQTGEIAAGYSKLESLLGQYLALNAQQLADEKRRAEEAKKAAEEKARRDAEAAAAAAAAAQRAAEDARARAEKVGGLNTKGVKAASLSAAQIGGANNLEFVINMFRTVMGREPTGGDVQHHLNILNKTGDRDRLLMYFRQNAEASVYLEGLRNQVRGLGAVPAFAEGGWHAGGLRLVGERGPEIEATGAARIWSAPQTRAILADDGGAGRDAVIELRALRQNLDRDGAALRAQVAALAAANDDLTRQVKKLASGLANAGGRS